MKTIQILFIFTISNFIAWNFIGLFFIISIACIFLFIVNLKKENVFYATLILFLVAFFLNFSTTFWLLEVTWWESILAFVGNSVFMTVPLFLTYYFSRKYNKVFYFFFIFWLIYEILHSYWDLSWPWLTFGNVMGNQYYFVQWYSILGIHFGSVWIIILGYLLYETLVNVKKSIFFMSFIIMLIFPITYSLYTYKIIPVNKSNPLKITTYIPNHKENESNYSKSKILYLKFLNKPLNNYLVCPEIFLSPISLKNIQKGAESIFFNKFLKQHNNVSLLFGAEILNKKEELFNSVVVLTADKCLVRTKKRYIPVREYTPPILSICFGKSFYRKNKDDNTNQILNQTKTFPMICYESIFSTFVANIALKSEVLYILTSEKFMNNSNFARQQYLNIVRLRAIENNRNILKCSNQGYSCVINEKGEITESIKKEVQNCTIYKIKNASIYQKIIKNL